MNDLEYLNQISAGANSKNVKPGLLGMFDKKMKIIFGILGGVILLVIILAIATGGKSKEEGPTDISEIGRLYHRSVEVSTAISKYSPFIANSSIRQKSSSLSTLLEEIISFARQYTLSLGIEVDPLPVTAADEESIRGLNTQLETARLKGKEIFDQTYAREMYYQISHLIVIEESIIGKTSDSFVKECLEQYIKSAQVLSDALKEL